jgi:hypothetical protein
MRTHAVSNYTLSIVHQSLSLERLMIHPWIDTPLRNKKKIEKEKADCIEAMVGEMAQFCNSSGSTTVLQHTCQQTLREFISYIVYAGELSYYNECITSSQTESVTATPTVTTQTPTVKKTKTFRNTDANASVNATAQQTTKTRKKRKPTFERANEQRVADPVTQAVVTPITNVYKQRSPREKNKKLNGFMESQSAVNETITPTSTPNTTTPLTTIPTDSPSILPIRQTNFYQSPKKETKIISQLITPSDIMLKRDLNKS